MEIDFSNAGFKENEVNAVALRLVSRLHELNQVVKQRNWNHDACSLLLPSEKEFVKQSKALAKKHAGAGAFIVVGIGGSNLGTMAIEKALVHKKVFYVDTVDSDAISEVLAKAKKEKSVVVNIISKSGSTTETLANAQVLLKELGAKARVVVTTDNGSKLEALARRSGFEVLGIPKKAGGRYSVFSNVGLFPLAWAGVNVKELLKGAEEMLGECLKPDWHANPALASAALIYLNYKRGRIVFDQFYFANDLEYLGKWYRQLLGESTGKNNVALTPTVSIGSTDLHSMGQAYLGGGDNKFFRLVQTRFKNKKIVPASKDFEQIVPNLSGKSFEKIMDSISQGFRTALTKKNRPFVLVELDGKNEEEIGGFMQLQMVELMLLAELLGVNAFDQPQVEDYKKVTRELLKK